jgi:hypothetical protein
MAERWSNGDSFTLSGTADEVGATALGRQHFLP